MTSLSSDMTSFDKVIKTLGLEKSKNMPLAHDISDDDLSEKSML